MEKVQGCLDEVGPASDRQIRSSGGGAGAPRRRRSGGNRWRRSGSGQVNEAPRQPVAGDPGAAVQFLTTGRLQRGGQGGGTGWPVGRTRDACVLWHLRSLGVSVCVLVMVGWEVPNT